MGSQLVTRRHRQWGVLWAATTPDKYGAMRVLQPVEIKCRWQLSSRLTSKNLSQHTELTGSLSVGVPVAVGSLVRKCRLTDIPEPYPERLDGLFRVVECGAVPDVQCRYTFYTLQLQAYSDTLPAITT